eukprot:Filipodium_phascolosomae@DN265_c0_g1_i1.p1
MFDIHSKLSDYGRNVGPNHILSFCVNTMVEGSIVLGGGLPPKDLFPITETVLTLSDGSTATLTHEDLGSALQYQLTGSSKALHDWITAFMRKQHSMPAHMSTVLTNGNSGAFAKVCAFLLNPGDIVILDEYTFSAYISLLRPYRPDLRVVPQDSKGMIPENLEEVIQGIPLEERIKIKFAYVIPTGQNPTTIDLDKERAKSLLAIAQKHGFFIVEDDPYWWVQLGPVDDTATHEFAGLTGLPPSSLLSLDTAGHVIRLDSFSKGFAPGFRCGWKQLRVKWEHVISANT